MCHIQRLDSERDTDAGGKRRESVPCILIWIKTEGCHRLLMFFSRPQFISSYVLLIYGKAAFLMPVLPLHKRAEVSAKARGDQCWVQGHKSGGYGAAVGCCRLAHSAGGDERRWLFSIRVRPIRPVRVYSPLPSPQPAHLSPHCCYARWADYWNRGKIAV